MRHVVDKRGEISLHPSKEEMEIIANLLSSRHLTLRKEQSPRQKCDQVISMMATMHDAILESNKVNKANNIRQTPIEHSQSNNSIFTRIYNFFQPELTISDFDNADTFCNQLFQITSMDFKVDNPRIPYHIRGYIQHKLDWMPATWNSHGKCSCPNLGKHQQLYNLRKAGRKNSNSLKFIFVSFWIVLLSAILYMLSNPNF